MPQMIVRPSPFLARLIFIVLAVTILPWFSGLSVQAEQPQPADRRDGTQPRATPALSGSRAAGAHWAEPWQGGGPKILDTRRSTPPARKGRRPPAPGSAESPESSPPTPSSPTIVADPYGWDWNYYRPYQYYPRTLYGWGTYGNRSFRLGFPAGRGYISAGRPFRGARPGFHGRGFKGRGFRGR